MKSYNKIKLNNIIRDLTCFLEEEYSSKFKNLTAEEDRHLFFLARILTQLKQVHREAINEENVIVFPKLEKLNK